MRGKTIFELSRQGRADGAFLKRDSVYEALQSILLLEDERNHSILPRVPSRKAGARRISRREFPSLTFANALGAILRYDWRACVTEITHHNGTTLLQEVKIAKIMDKKTFEWAMCLAQMITTDKE
jgi:fumarate hydratase class II